MDQAVPRGGSARVSPVFESSRAKGERLPAPPANLQFARAGRHQPQIGRFARPASPALHVSRGRRRTSLARKLGTSILTPPPDQRHPLFRQSSSAATSAPFEETGQSGPARVALSLCPRAGVSESLATRLLGDELRSSRPRESTPSHACECGRYQWLPADLRLDNKGVSSRLRSGIFRGGPSGIESDRHHPAGAGNCLPQPDGPRRPRCSPIGARRRPFASRYARSLSTRPGQARTGRSARGQTRCREGPCMLRTIPCPEPGPARLPRPQAP
jgi:hypothetical protein